MIPASEIIEKAYAYVTRRRDHELLVFEHPVPEAGIQVPKGTLETGEDPHEAVVREVREEAGLTDFRTVRALASDRWSHPRKPVAYRRHFFHLSVEEARDEWHHTVTGGGEDDGLVFQYFWADPGGVSLIADMGDHLDRIP